MSPFGSLTLNFTRASADLLCLPFKPIQCPVVGSPSGAGGCLAYRHDYIINGYFLFAMASLAMVWNIVACEGNRQACSLLFPVYTVRLAQPVQYQHSVYTKQQSNVGPKQ